MSIEIDWETLTTGPDGLALAESIRAFVHDRFQQVALPRFIQSVQVHSFEFGDVPPEIAIRDICNPLPEFYLEDEDDDENEEAVVSKEQETTTPDTPDHPANLDRPTLSERRQQRRSFTNPTEDSATNPIARPHINTHRAPLPSMFKTSASTDQLTNPLLGNNTPGIPGGTSNLGYFHLPLAPGLRSGTATPLAAVAGAHFPTIPRPALQTSHHPQHNLSISSTSSTLPSPSPPPSPPAPPTNHLTTRDFQTNMRIHYSGPIRLCLTADILLDYPMPSFVGIPVRLTITGLTFDGLALLALIFRNSKRDQASSTEDEEEQEKGENKACFCFLNTPGPNPVSTSDDFATTAGGAGEGGLLREIKVESEIGKRENGRGQSLKNVGKVERFVLEQVRRIFEEELVWPSFWTFLI